MVLPAGWKFVASTTSVSPSKRPRESPRWWRILGGYGRASVERNHADSERDAAVRERKIRRAARPWGLCGGTRGAPLDGLRRQRGQAPIGGVLDQRGAALEDLRGARLHRRDFLLREQRLAGELRGRSSGVALLFSQVPCRSGWPFGGCGGAHGGSAPARPAMTIIRGRSSRGLRMDDDSTPAPCRNEARAPPTLHDICITRRGDRRRARSSAAQDRARRRLAGSRAGMGL